MPKLNKLASTKKGLSVEELKIVKNDKAPTNIVNRVDAKVILPTITLYQPYAYFVIKGWKTIETRLHDRFKNLLGKRVAIHSAKKKIDYWNDISKNKYLTFEQMHEALDAIDSYKYDAKYMERGYILGTATVEATGWLNKTATIYSKQALIDCQSTDRFGLWLTQVQPFAKPIEAKGKQGIWYSELAV